MPIVKKLFRSASFWIFVIFGVTAAYRFYDEFEKIQGEPMQSWQKTSLADCAVVLTGGPGRVREGFDLLANQNIKKLIIAGVFSNARLREIMPLWSFYGNLSENDVVLDRRSETTYGNAQQSLPLVEALNCRDVLLITSRTHMHRAYNTFRATYPENIFIKKHAIIGGKFKSSVWEVGFEALKSLFYTIWAY